MISKGSKLVGGETRETLIDGCYATNIAFSFTGSLVAHPHTLHQVTIFIDIITLLVEEINLFKLCNFISFCSPNKAKN